MARLAGGRLRPGFAGFRQEKTSNPLVLSWRLVPALVQRVAATTFFHELAGRPWKNADTFRDAFNELRDCLTKKNASFETRYYVGLDPKDPLRLPAKNLTMRTMRHTYITLNHNAGVPRELSRGITGHELDTIDDALKCYATVTADQAAAALNIRPAEHLSRTRATRATDSPCSFSLCGSLQRNAKKLASLKRTRLGSWRARRDSNS